MPEDQVTIVGLNAFTRSCRAAGANMRDFKDASQRTGRIVASAATAGAPRRRGKLAASIRPGRTVSGVVVRAGSAAVPYAAPIHWGWGRRNIPANPFLSRAARGTEAQWTAAYSQELQSIVDKVHGT